jgi:hypothetical protein
MLMQIGHDPHPLACCAQEPSWCKRRVAIYAVAHQEGDLLEDVKAGLVPPSKTSPVLRKQSIAYRFVEDQDGNRMIDATPKAGAAAVPHTSQHWALILGHLGNINMAEIDACNHQIECLRQMGAPQWTIDGAQQYLHKNETVFATAMQAFTNFLFSKDHLEQSRLYAERTLEKYRFELNTLIPGVLETGVCEVIGSDGRKTYGISVRVVGSVSLPATLEGVPVVLRPGY